jgi:hypothetical protein
VNPAQNLYDFLIEAKEGTRTGNQWPSHARNLDDDASMDVQLQAVQDLIALRRGLDELEAKGRRISVYRKYLRPWTDMVLSYPEGWTNAVNPDMAYPSSTLDHLYSLASWFEQDARVPDDESQDELREFLQNVTDLIEGDETISLDLKDYLYRLVREMQNALADEQVFKRFDFEDAGRRLWTALHTASNMSGDEQTKKQWRDFADKLWWPTVAGTLGSAPSIIAGVLTAGGH